MALTQLTCDTIGDLDGGRARAMINAVLSEMYRDCDDRGHDERAREVVIKINAVASKGMIVLDLQAAVKLPPHRTNNTAACMHNSKDGKRPILCFQEHDPENPNQGTFGVMDGDGEIPNE